MVKRKTPIQHKVRSHTREGKPVKSFTRGSGTSRKKPKRAVVAAPQEVYEERWEWPPVTEEDVQPILDRWNKKHEMNIYLVGGLATVGETQHDIDLMFDRPFVSDEDYTDEENDFVIGIWSEFRLPVQVFDRDGRLRFSIY